MCCQVFIELVFSLVLLNLAIILQLTLLTYFYPSSTEQLHVIHIAGCPVVIGGKCDSTEVKFYLYSRLNKKVPDYVEFIEDDKDNLTSSTYDWRLENKMILHGYSSDMHLNVLQNVKNEYLKSLNANIWMVDYPNLVIGPCYPFATYNIRYIGKCIASFIKRLNETTKDQLDIHLVGFSLGGQIPNFVAQNLPFKLPRISALDPALPFFYTSILSQRLDPTDAKFVNVIHTNSLFQGQVLPCGHVDFYVNGGVFQPGCEGIDRFNCYHSRSVEYFAESINTKIGFWGWPCPSFLDFIEFKCKPKEPLRLMGEHADPRFPGIFLLNTSSNSPYALGKDILIQNGTLITVEMMNDIKHVSWPRYTYNMTTNTYITNDSVHDYLPNLRFTGNPR